MEDEYHIPTVPVSAATKEGIDELRGLLIRSLPADYESGSITGDLVQEGDVVLLVMPQDTQAPKGRLILPQVQVIRELLDKKCIVMSVTTDKLKDGLASLKNPPKLIITDSQVFRTVYDNKPEESMLTSFSVLLAGYKGDLRYFAESANAIDRLTENSRVLIAEACTHAPLEEDIGRVKIPAMLRKKVGQGLQVDVVAGADFPADVTGYDLIIHCGACMFNRKYVLSRVEKTRQAHVPMSNYGVVLAYLSGILEKISLP
jgi:[FeFe] hydrogenase H-cluster maturation GTPase HydF